MEVSEVRKRVRQAIEEARHADAARRERHDAAAKVYADFLEQVATPLFKHVATSLRAEGFPFTVSTPAGAVRLGSDSAGENFIELSLDTTDDDPQVVGRTSRGRGRRMIRAERPIREGRAISQLKEEDVLEFLLEEIAGFVRR